MEYFRILNLRQEPFSNSPEPAFFFEAREHQRCLQKLELAIRLRRGLNAVIGEVGTGKTTLCRQLILKLASRGESADVVQTHLLLDPSFDNSLEFLRTIGAMFALPSCREDTSEWQIKERIKDYLLQAGVDRGEIVVLIIDEGQKLPPFCIEILREFLNYETSEHKLLQIVVFAQPEFRQLLKTHHNFADRVNEYCLLKPLNLRETARMIGFRIAKASAAEEPPKLFTLPALLAVYFCTKGYPRRINTLCHQTMLSLIIQNRTRATWSLVRACSARVSLPRRFGFRWATTILATLLMVSLIALAADRSGIVSFSAGRERIAVKREAPPLPTTSAKIEKQAGGERADHAPVPDEARVSQTVMPDLLGRITIRRGENLWWIFTDIYGSFDDVRFKAFVRANPHVSNVNHVMAGAHLNLPAVPARSASAQTLKDRYWVRLTSKSSLGEAYEFLRKYPTNLPPVRLLPYWNSSEGTVFAVILRDNFRNELRAREAADRLTPSLPAEAVVVSKWHDGTIFFSEL